MSLYLPRPVIVIPDGDGNPVRVGGREVESVREDWLVEDRWWTALPLRRRYFEVVLADGSDVTVFTDLLTGRWRSHRA
jgi:hypothetical protein